MITDEVVETPLGKQQVRRGGAGRPLLYLHSATGETPFSPLLDDLAADFDVVAPVFPGFGESEGIEQIGDIEDAAFHLVDLIGTIGVDRPVGVGLSLGAWLAVEVAVRWPETFAGLVLVNPVGLYIDGAPIGEIFGRNPDELAEVLFHDQSHPIPQMLHQAAALIESGGEIPFELIKPQIQNLAATARLAWNPYLHDPKLPRRLRRIDCPVLVVRATADKLVPPVHAERYAELLPNARLVDVPDAGHLLGVEQPDALAALIREHAAGL
jgi:2-hydroxy-6-oxonona-2,4-dienedioate hydrolase